MNNRAQSTTAKMSVKNILGDLEFEFTSDNRHDSAMPIEAPKKSSTAHEPALSRSSSVYSQEPACSGALPQRPDEGYASTISSSKVTSTPPTAPPPSQALQATVQDDDDPITPVKPLQVHKPTHHTDAPTPKQKDQPPEDDYEQFITAATIDAIVPGTQRRRNPKMSRRRRSSSLLSAITPPANYVALQPERFPIADMRAAYEAMASHNSRTAELTKTSQREHQRHLSNANVWQRFAYVLAGKPCYESPEGCCFMSAERGEDGTGHGHADGVCTHFGCRGPLCCLGLKYCDGGACCEGCGCTRCCGWEHGCWSVCDGWFGGWTWWCCGKEEQEEK
jgi:hypothetical protein